MYFKKKQIYNVFVLMRRGEKIIDSCVNKICIVRLTGNVVERSITSMAVCILVLGSFALSALFYLSKFTL